VDFKRITTYTLESFYQEIAKVKLLQMKERFLPILGYHI